MLLYCGLGLRVSGRVRGRLSLGEALAPGGRRKPVVYAAIKKDVSVWGLGF